MKVQKTQRTIGMPTRTQVNAGAGGFNMDCVDAVSYYFDCPDYTGDLAWVCNDGVEEACKDLQSTCPQVVNSCGCP